MTVQVTTLPNGFRVISDRMERLESATVGVWVDAGARNEAHLENGLSHLLEHMAFKGTERRTARQIAEEIEHVGGSLNAYTSRDSTAYYARILKDDLGLAIDILSDILKNSTFNETELARERDVVIQEIGQAHDTPDDIIFDHFQETAYPDQPVGRPILGPAEQVRNYGRDDLIQYMSRNYKAPNMLLVATGAIDHGEVVARAEQAFGDLAPECHAPSEKARYQGGDFRSERELEQTHLILGFEGVPYEDPDFYAMQVMNVVLGGGMSSRLFQEVRETRGLAYAIYSFAASYEDTGLHGVYAGTGPAELPELLAVTAGEIVRLSEDASEEETARARAQLKASMLMSLESSAGRAEQLARQMLVYGRLLPLSELTNRIDAVDAAAVRAVAGRILKGSRPTVAALGPTARLESFDRIAARFG